MYLSFYGLSRTPFHITPDPSFLYLSPSHKEAYASIMYGVAERKGFLAVTGEVGLGKTTVLRAYLEQLDKENITPVYLFDPSVGFHHLVDAVLRDLSIDVPPGTDTAGKVQRLHWRLVEEYKAGRTIVLIIDEGQNMPVETLEQLRVLSNLETAQDKLLQVVLVGQPELEDKLARHELRQLNQRIAVRCRLKPLSRKESLAYLHHRIAQAGAKPEALFTPGALQALVRYARGNPRTLNIACDNALASGYGYERRPVTAPIVREVTSELRGRKHRPWLPYVAGATAVFVLSLFGAAGLYALGTREMEGNRPVARTAAPATDAAPAPAGASGPAPAPEVVAEPTPNPDPGPEMERLARAMETAAPAASAAPARTPGPLPAAAAAPERDTPEPDAVAPEASESDAPLGPPQTAPVSPAQDRATGNASPPEEVPAATTTPVPPARAPREPMTLARDNESGELLAAVAAQAASTAAQREAEAKANLERAAAMAAQALVPAGETPEDGGDAPLAEAAAPPVDEPALGTLTPPVPRTRPARNTVTFTRDDALRVEVTQGDMLTRLVARVYGVSNRELVDAVLAMNPQIREADIIYAGDTLWFPEVAGYTRRYPELPKEEAPAPPPTEPAPQQVTEAAVESTS